MPVQAGALRLRKGVVSDKQCTGVPRPAGVGEGCADLGPACPVVAARAHVLPGDGAVLCGNVGSFLFPVVFSVTVQFSRQRSACRDL